MWVTKEQASRKFGGDGKEQERKKKERKREKERKGKKERERVKKQVRLYNIHGQGTYPPSLPRDERKSTKK